MPPFAIPTIGPAAVGLAQARREPKLIEFPKRKHDTRVLDQSTGARFESKPTVLVAADKPKVRAA